MKFNYQTICHSNMLREVPGRTKDVLSRRFGLRGERETLESIGEAYGVTRERVRQIQDDGIGRLNKRIEAPDCQRVFQYFAKELNSSGSLRKEDVLLADLGGPKFKNHVYFLLTLGEPFQKFSETKDLYAFWSTSKNAPSLAKKSINVFITELKKKNKPLALVKNIPASHIEVSKKILKSPDGLYGLKDWPEINPKGIKDKAYIILKKEAEPLHFTRVASLIGKDTLCQTVHNELIKDSRFVLVGRGLYALKEWGYDPGIVREVIYSILKTSKKPMARDGVIEKVLKQRYVKPNTVLLNLQNKKYFIRTKEGKYTTREA